MPDRFSDFAEALANPIRYQSEQEKRAQQLRVLTEDDDTGEGDDTRSGNEIGGGGAVANGTAAGGGGAGGVGDGTLSRSMEKLPGISSYAFSSSSSSSSSNNQSNRLSKKLSLKKCTSLAATVTAGCGSASILRGEKSIGGVTLAPIPSGEGGGGGGAGAIVGAAVPTSSSPSLVSSRLQPSLSRSHQHQQQLPSQQQQQQQQQSCQPPSYDSVESFLQHKSVVDKMSERDKKWSNIQKNYDKVCVFTDRDKVVVFSQLGKKNIYFVTIYAVFVQNVYVFFFRKSRKLGKVSRPKKTN